MRPAGIASAGFATPTIGHSAKPATRDNPPPLTNSEDLTTQRAIALGVVAVEPRNIFGCRWRHDFGTRRYRFAPGVYELAALK